jgi:hypothetical protein
LYPKLENAPVSIVVKLVLLKVTKAALIQEEKALIPILVIFESIVIEVRFSQPLNELSGIVVTSEVAVTVNAPLRLMAPLYKPGEVNVLVSIVIGTAADQIKGLIEKSLVSILALSFLTVSAEIEKFGLLALLVNQSELPP